MAAPKLRIFQRGKSPDRGPVCVMYREVPLPIGVTIPEKHFDAKARWGQWVLKGYNGYTSANLTISATLKALDEEIDRHNKEFLKGNKLYAEKYPTPENLKLFLNTRGISADGEPTVKDLWLQMIEQKRSDGVSAGTIGQYESMLNALERFTPGLKVADINEKLFYRYKKYLQAKNIEGVTDPGKQRKLSSNTVTQYLQFVSYFLTFVSKKIKTPVDPELIELFASGIIVKPDKIALLPDEIDLLFTYQFKKQRHREIIDFWLAMNLTGWRHSDMSEPERWIIANNIIKVQPRKTSNPNLVANARTASAPIIGRFKELLEKYNYKLPEVTLGDFKFHLRNIVKHVGLNRKIKLQHNRLGFKAGETVELWQVLTGHKGKASFINDALRNEISLTRLSQLTGTSVPTILSSYVPEDDAALIKLMEEKEQNRLRVTHLNKSA